jgi:hypothetical protein
VKRSNRSWALGLFVLAFTAGCLVNVPMASAGGKDPMDIAIKEAREAAIAQLKDDALKAHGAAFVAKMTILCIETRSEQWYGFTSKATAAVRCENTNQHQRDKNANAYAYIVKTYGDGNPPEHTEIDAKTFKYDEKTYVVQVGSMTWRPGKYWYEFADNGHWRNSENSGGVNQNNYRYMDAKSENVYDNVPGTSLYQYIQVSDGDGHFRSKLNQNQNDEN